MERNVGDVIEDGYVWRFPNESFTMWDCFSGKFPADSDDVDLEYFDLFYATKGEFGFALARLPFGKQIDLVINVQIADVTNGNVYMDNIWKVENLYDRYVFLQFKGWPPINTSGVWKTSVTIRSVKRIVGSGKTPVAVLIGSQTVFAATSVASKTTDDHQIASVSKMDSFDAVSSECEDDSSSDPESDADSSEDDSSNEEESEVSFSLLDINDDIECSQPQAKKRKMSQSATDDVGIGDESVAPVAMETFSHPMSNVETDMITGDATNIKTERWTPSPTGSDTNEKPLIQNRKVKEKIIVIDISDDEIADQSEVSLGGVNDAIGEPNPTESTLPPAKRPKMGHSVTDFVGINGESVVTGAVEIPSPPMRVKDEIIIEDDLPVYPGWEADSFADFEIRTADNYRFPVSKSIMARNSDVFKALLSPDTLESQRGHTTTQYDADVILPLLKFIYPGNFDLDLSVVAMELFRAAQYYHIDGLKDRCEEEMKKQISLENLISVVELADQFKSIPLMQKCIEFIRKRRTDVHIWNAMSPLGATIPSVLAQIIALANSRGKLNLQNFRFSQ